MSQKYTCKLNDTQSFEVKLLESVFHPRGTSDEIIKAVSANISSPGKILDLGCGAGVVGCALCILCKSVGSLFCPDKC